MNTNIRQLPSGQIRWPFKSFPNTIHPVRATNIAPIIQNDATTEIILPRIGVGKSSAPKENTIGTEPPIPKIQKEMKILELKLLFESQKKLPTKTTNNSQNYKSSNIWSTS
jgi:hypothetical protein